MVSASRSKVRKSGNPRLVSGIKTSSYKAMKAGAPLGKPQRKTRHDNHERRHSGNARIDAHFDGREDEDRQRRLARPDQEDRHGHVVERSHEGEEASGDKARR